MAAAAARRDTRAGAASAVADTSRARPAAVHRRRAPVAAGRSPLLAALGIAGAVRPAALADSLVWVVVPDSPALPGALADSPARLGSPALPPARRSRPDNLAMRRGARAVAVVRSGSTGAHLASGVPSTESDRLAARPSAGSAPLLARSQAGSQTPAASCSDAACQSTTACVCRSYASARIAASPR